MTNAYATIDIKLKSIKTSLNKTCNAQRRNTRVLYRVWRGAG